MSKNIGISLAKTKKEFQNQFMVAFLGEKHSGKTIACALLKDALTRHYEKYSKGEYFGISTHGSTRMNKLIDKLTNEIFPAKTLLSEATPMTLEIVSPNAGDTIEIILRDMAGEKRKDLLQAEFPNVDERLQAIFNTSKLLTHVLFAKIYLFVIDCSKFGDDNKLRMEDAYVKDTILHLFDIKERAEELTGNRMHDPIAFIFTKYDLLPEKKQKLPSELIKLFPETLGALKRRHVGDLAYFKSSVVSVKKSPAEIQKEIKEKQKLNEDLINAEENVKDLEVKQSDLQNELDDAKQELESAKQRLEEIRPQNIPEQISKEEQNVRDVEEEVNSSQESLDDATEERDEARKRLIKLKSELEDNPPTTLEDLGISEYKPKKPLSYSLDDYLELIAWIIKMNKQIRGYSSK